MAQQYVWWAFGTRPSDVKVSSTAYEAVGKYLAHHGADTYMYPAVIIQYVDSCSMYKVFKSKQTSHQVTW